MSACILWQGPINKQTGYGVNKGKGAHRSAYEQHYGAIPRGQVVRHKCDTPLCVNPQHLELGTQAQNILDSCVRGRQARTLEPHQVLEIRDDTRPYRTIAQQYNVTHDAVYKIKKKITWKHI